MVLGIGEGSIDIKIDRTNFKIGETVKGEVFLSLSQPKKARELRVLFYGEVKEHHGKHSSTKRIFEQLISLGGEQEYPATSKSYPFEIKIPDIPKPVEGGSGIVASVLNFIASFSDPVSRASWYLDASLDVPMSFDISKKTRIYLSR